MNKKSATVNNDVPIKLLCQFSEYISKPLCNILNSMFEQGTYPTIWKQEYITPVEKVSPAEDMSQLRPISVCLNFAKLADKIISHLIIKDMAPQRDPSQ